jgi:hypothetical protein
MVSSTPPSISLVEIEGTISDSIKVLSSSSRLSRLSANSFLFFSASSRAASASSLKDSASCLNLSASNILSKAV